MISIRLYCSLLNILGELEEWVFVVFAESVDRYCFTFIRIGIVNNNLSIIIHNVF